MPRLYLVIKVVKVNVTANPLRTAIILPGHNRLMGRAAHSCLAGWECAVRSVSVFQFIESVRSPPFLHLGAEYPHAAFCPDTNN